MKKIRFTLKARLVLWTALILFITGFSLVLTINGIASIIFPKVFAVQPNQTSVFSEDLDGAIKLSPSSQIELDSNNELAIKAPSTDQAVQNALHKLQVSSIKSLAIILILGCMGAYWLSNKALSPVQQLSHTIKKINANNLSEPIPIEGPNDEIQELTHSFNVMLKRLDNMFHQQRSFTSNAAHELRTPLAILQTNLEVVRDDPDVEQKDYEHLIVVFERTVDRLKEMIDDLLVMSNGQELTFKEKIYLKDLMEEVVSELSPLAQKYQVSFQLGELDIHVYGKKVLLHRAFSNILENGIRYNRAGGSVTISMEKHQDDVLIHFADTGVGILKDEQPHIFESFYRIEQSRSRHTGGVGLGLALTSLIVKRHGGNIHVVSEPGNGSTFTVKIPINAQNQEG